MPMASSRVRSLLRSASNPIPSTASAEQTAMAQAMAMTMAMATDDPITSSAPPLHAAPLAHPHPLSLPSAPMAPAPSVSSVSYARLIARQDWDTVRDCLSTDEGVLHARCEMDTASSPDVNVDGGALHFACRFHPPLDIIMALAEIIPASSRVADNRGRFPLHIAAKWGASPRVIKFLIQIFPDAAALQDAMGKTPLHLACESYASKYSPRKAENQPLKDAMVEVVRRLCRAAPDSVNLEDMEDMTALEYAIDADVELKVVRSIQKACEKDWKARREEQVIPGGSGKTTLSHEDMRRGMLEQAQQNSQRLRSDLLEQSAVQQEAAVQAQAAQVQQQQQHASSVRHLQMDLKDVTATAMNMSLSAGAVGGDEKKAVLGTRQRAPLRHVPKKKPSTRALMA